MKYFLPGFRTKNVLDVNITWTYVNEKYHFDIFLSNFIFVSYQWILCVWWMKPFVYNPTIKVNKHYTYFPFVHISWWVFDDTESLERFSFTNINRKGFDVLFPADDFGFEGKCGHWRVYKLNWKNVKCAILINLTCCPLNTMLYTSCLLWQDGHGLVFLFEKFSQVRYPTQKCFLSDLV